MKRTSPLFTVFREGLVRGIGWSIGVTIGFALISTVVVVGLRRAGGIPVVGQFIAAIVEATQAQLQARTPVYINGAQ